MTGIPGRIGAALRYLVPLAVTLVAAIAAIAVIPDHKRLVRWLYVILLVSAVALVVSVVMICVQSYLDGRRNRRTRDDTVARALRLPVVRAEQARPEQLGIDPVDPRVLGRATEVDGDQLRYVARGVDNRVRAHLARAHEGTGPTLVCLFGPSKAGKSRTMFEAVRAELPKAAVVAPDRTRENLQTVIEHGVLEQADEGRGRSIVLWLDDLEGYVRMAGGGLSASDVRALKSSFPGLVIATTAGGRGIENCSSDDPAFADPLRLLLAISAQEYVLSELTGSERGSLNSVVEPALAVEMYESIGSIAVSGPELVRILVNERHPNFDHGNRCREGAAVTWALVTAQRLSGASAVSRELLRRLFPCYLAAATDESFERALQWATSPLYAQVSPVRADASSYRAYDYLVQNAPDRDDQATRCVWRELLRTSAPGETVALGIAAHEQRRTNDALEAFREAEQAGHGVALILLGLLLEEIGRSAEAEQLWRDADAAGDPEASGRLGVLLRARGELDAAEDAFRRGDERGHAEAAVDLGRLLQQRGDPEGARAAWARAEGRGSPRGAHNLGTLEHEQGNLAEAESAWRRADRLGSPDAPLSLGVLLKECGDLDDADAAFRRADARGSAKGAFALGSLLRDAGRPDEAVAAFRRGDDRGDADAALSLGALLLESNETDQAEAAFRRADERGNIEGSFALGLVRYNAGDCNGAMTAWRRAAEGGSGKALINLAGLLEQRGDIQGATEVLRRAAVFNDPEIAGRARHALEKMK